MPKQPIISVVIDTYNYAAYIEKAIDSVLAQTFPRECIEIIIVDDGSQDDTSRLVQAYGNQVVYHRKENGGQASAFNAGISIARGMYISFLDADDYFYPSKLAEVLKVFESDKSIGIVYNKFDMVDDSGKIVTRNMPIKLHSGDIRHRIAMGYLTGSPSSGISIKRELGLHIPIPEPPFRISADYFILNIYPLLTRVGIVETPEHAYRIHGSNLYIKKDRAEQIRIHALQNESIYQYSEQIGFPFFRALHDLNHHTKATHINGRVGIFLKGLRWLLSSNSNTKLRLRTLGKLTVRMILPESIYRKLQLHRETL
jgi:glycosyltransferase involved in cell wall biosynthesis